MNNEHDNRPNPLNQHQPQISPSFLFYSTLCIVCILVSFRHIKAYRHRSRHRRGVHCKSLPPERQTMASSPDQKAGGEPGQLEEGQPVSDSAIHHHRHPSACDILQPLSHLVPVPASGHVAAAVAAGAAERQRASTMASPSARSDLPPTPPPPPPPPKQDSQQSSRKDAEPNSAAAGAGPAAGAGAIDPHHRPCCHPVEKVENPSSTNPPSSSSSHIHNPAGPVQYPSIPAVGTSGPGVAVHSTRPAEGFCRPIQPQQNPIPGPGQAENVAKRTETVQFCRDVDAEGIRSWRRLIVEYG